MMACSQKSPAGGGASYSLIYRNQKQRPESASIRRRKREILAEERCRQMERAYCALEHALICLHMGQPLFFPFEEMQEYNDVYRRELMCGLILALDLLRQSGVSAEETALVEKIHRAYTSA